MLWLKGLCHEMVWEFFALHVQIFAQLSTAAGFYIRQRLLLFYKGDCIFPAVNARVSLRNYKTWSVIPKMGRGTLIWRIFLWLNSCFLLVHFVGMLT